MIPFLVKINNKNNHNNGNIFFFVSIFFSNIISALPWGGARGTCPPCPPLATPLRWGNARVQCTLYILNDIIFRNVQVWQNYEYNRTVLFQKGDRGVAPENFWKSMHVQTFLTPPLCEFETFLTPPFGGLKLFWPPLFGASKLFWPPLLIFQPPLPRYLWTLPIVNLSFITFNSWHLILRHNSLHSVNLLGPQLT